MKITVHLLRPYKVFVFRFVYFNLTRRSMAHEAHSPGLRRVPRTTLRFKPTLITL